jgi:hypothetical protein
MLGMYIGTIMAAVVASIAEYWISSMAADLREEEKEKRAEVASTVVKSLSRNWPDVHYIVSCRRQANVV